MNHIQILVLPICFVMLIIVVWVVPAKQANKIDLHVGNKVIVKNRDNAQIGTLTDFEFRGYGGTYSIKVVVDYPKHEGNTSQDIVDIAEVQKVSP
jgi:hypothetical protein